MRRNSKYGGLENMLQNGHTSLWDFSESNQQLSHFAILLHNLNQCTRFSTPIIVLFRKVVISALFWLFLSKVDAFLARAVKNARIKLESSNFEELMFVHRLFVRPKQRFIKIF